MSVDKDDYRVQTARLERLAHELAPGGTVDFDPDRLPHFIGMRVDHPTTGTVLTVTSGDWLVSEIADKTDDELRILLKSWSGGRL